MVHIPAKTVTQGPRGHQNLAVMVVTVRQDQVVLAVVKLAVHHMQIKVKTKAPIPMILLVVRQLQEHNKMVKVEVQGMLRYNIVHQHVG